MSEALSSSAQRVQDFLKAQDCAFQVRELDDSTRTAQAAADALECTVGQIAKSLVFVDQATGDPILVIASGSNRVDVKKIEEATGLVLEKADGKWVKKIVGFAIGGVPPVGHLQPLRTFLDPDLRQYDVIWAAAGTPHAVFALTPAELERVTNGTVVPLAEG